MIPENVTMRSKRSPQTRAYFCENRKKKHPFATSYNLTLYQNI